MGAEERLELLQQGLRIDALLNLLVRDDDVTQVDSVPVAWMRSTDRSAWVGAAVGICSALRTGDWLSTCQAGPAFALAKGSSALTVVGELLGRSDGVCHGRSGFIWSVDRRLRLAAWPSARIALATTLGWAQACGSLALAVVPEHASPETVVSCLREAARFQRPMTVISIATEPERDPLMPTAVRCPDVESIASAVHQGVQRARDHRTGTHLRLWLPHFPSSAAVGEHFVRQRVITSGGLAELTQQAEHEAREVLTGAHTQGVPRTASAFQYVW